MVLKFKNNMKNFLEFFEVLRGLKYFRNFSRNFLEISWKFFGNFLEIFLKYFEEPWRF